MGIPSSSIISNAVIPPSPPADSTWQDVFWHISQPEAEPTLFDPKIRGIQNWILAEVIRREWDPKYRITEISKPLNANIQAWGEVAHKLLKLIEKVNAHVPEKLGDKHDAEWFAYLLIEREAIGHVYTGEISGKDALTRHMANQNEQLRSKFSNPYGEHATKAFFDVAVALAKTDDQFVKPLRAYTAARSALVKLAKKKGSESGFTAYRNLPSGEVTPIRQGRKKSVSETLDI